MSYALYDPVNQSRRKTRADLQRLCKLGFFSVSYANENKETADYIFTYLSSPLSLSHNLYMCMYNTHTHITFVFVRELIKLNGFSLFSFSAGILS